MADDAQVSISKIQAETIRVPIIGTAPLIVHRFGEKARKEMLDRFQGRRSPKQPKDPDAEYEAAFYRFTDEAGHTIADRFGFPAVAFKAATVSAARFYGKDVKMTELRQFVFVDGLLGADGQKLVEIEGKPVMREDVVRLSMSSTDLRYRPMFPEWKATLTITYVTSALTRNSLLSLIDAGGMGVGVGEWRPERKGDFGTYQIDLDRDVERYEVVEP